MQQSQTVLVTGAAGFVGSHLIPMLKSAGYEVGVIVKKSEVKKIKTTGVEIIEGDLSKNTNWVGKLKKYDILIHLAAQISSKTYHEFKKNNVDATDNLLQAAKKAKIKKIILFSSAAVTSIRQDWYAETKAKQEELVVNSGLNYFILRPSMIYGPGDTKNMGWLIGFIKKYPVIPLPGGGNFGRQPVFVEDLCRVVLKLLKIKVPNKIIEIHGYEYVTMKKMVTTISGMMKNRKYLIKIPLPILVFSFWLGERLIANPKFTVDQIQSLILGEKFKGERWWKTFSIKPTKFEDGIRKMIS